MEGFNVEETVSWKLFADVVETLTQNLLEGQDWPGMYIAYAGKWLIVVVTIVIPQSHMCCSTALSVQLTRHAIFLFKCNPNSKLVGCPTTVPNGECALQQSCP